MTKRGRFVVFEGIDGCGKSTQIGLAADYLASKGVDCWVTREPTSGSTGLLLRQCLEGKMESSEQRIAELFAQDRYEHIFDASNGILSKLEAGITVLCDRYYYSSYAYHGVHLDMDWVFLLNKACSDALKADLTIFLDIDPQISLQRIKKRGANEERYEKLDNMIRVRQNYLHAFSKYNDQNVAIVDGSKSVQEVSSQIFALLNVAYK